MKDQILEAATTSDGQYVLVVTGGSTPSDGKPLRTFIREKLCGMASASC